MKKISEKHSDSDRIICVSSPEKQNFYYQAAKSNERVWLFETPFSGSVFAYFREKGRMRAAREFSLSIRELYEFNDYHNVKLARVMQRIPGQVEYILKYELCERVPRSYRSGRNEDCARCA